MTSGGKVRKSGTTKSAKYPMLVKIANKYANDPATLNKVLEKVFTKTGLKKLQAGRGRIGPRNLPDQLVSVLIDNIKKGHKVFLPRAEVIVSVKGDKINKVEIRVGNRELISELKIPSDKVVLHIQGYVNIDKYGPNYDINFSDRMHAHLHPSGTLLLARNEETIDNILKGQKIRKSTPLIDYLRQIGVITD